MEKFVFFNKKCFGYDCDFWVNDWRCYSLYNIIILYLDCIKFKRIFCLICCVFFVIYLECVVMMYCYILYVIYGVGNK